MSSGHKMDGDANLGAVILLDGRANLLDIDGMAEQLTGWGALSLIGQQVDKMIFHPSLAGGLAVQDMIDRCLSEKKDAVYSDLIVECLGGRMQKVSAGLLRFYIEEDANVFALVLTGKMETNTAMESYDAGYCAVESTQGVHPVEIGARTLH